MARKRAWKTCLEGFGPESRNAREHWRLSSSKKLASPVGRVTGTENPLISRTYETICSPTGAPLWDTPGACQNGVSAVSTRGTELAACHQALDLADRRSAAWIRA
jgi:hypothetical protein